MFSEKCERVSCVCGQTAKNLYIAPEKSAHLVDCLFDFSTRLKTLSRGIASRFWLRFCPRRVAFCSIALAFWYVVPCFLVLQFAVVLFVLLSFVVVDL